MNSQRHLVFVILWLTGQLYDIYYRSQLVHIFRMLFALVDDNRLIWIWPFYGVNIPMESPPPPQTPRLSSNGMACFGFLVMPRYVVSFCALRALVCCSSSEFYAFQNWKLKEKCFLFLNLWLLPCKFYICVLGEGRSEGLCLLIAFAYWMHRGSVRRQPVSTRFTMIAEFGSRSYFKLLNLKLNVGKVQNYL